MSNINKLTIEGRLTRDPETKFTATGKRVCAFAIAYNTYRKEGDQWVTAGTHFFDCSAWEGLAEKAGVFHKGDPVYIEGQLRQDRWEQDGRTRSAVKINVTEIRLADWAKPKEQAQSAAPAVTDDDIPF